MNHSRRKVIKSLGLVAGATAIGFIPGVQSIIREETRTGLQGNYLHTLKNAILMGAGNRGGNFIAFAEKYPKLLHIAGIAEPKAERRSNTARALGIETQYQHTDWKSALEDEIPAEVVIITASGNYFELCAKALKKGYDVWVDRPASLDASQVASINKLAKDNNRSLLYAYIHDEKIQFMDHRLFENNPANNS